jgi:uncharacterized protein
VPAVFVTSPGLDRINPAEEAISSTGYPVLGGAAIQPLWYQWLLFSALIGFCTVVYCSSASAQSYLAASQAYDRGDYASALEITAPLAELGNPNAQFLLALMYDDGDGVALDDGTAIRWYQQAAEQGHSGAQFNLAYMHDHGEGTAENNLQALRWYTRAAEQGDAAAQMNLALMHDFAESGIARDISEALKWYSAAAAQDIRGAQYNLAVIYDEGDGVPEDNVKAMYWYQRSAMLGDTNSQTNLGVMYFYGEGTEQSAVDGLAWTYLAAEAEAEFASGNAELFERETSDAEIQQAKRRAAQLRLTLVR